MRTPVSSNGHIQREPVPARHPVPLDPYALFPDQLKAFAQWVVWRAEERNGRITKVPYCARTGGAGSSTNPETWSTYEQARAVADAYNGIGFTLAESNRLVGIDIDHCIDDQGVIAPWAQAIIDALQSYTEITPSNCGVRIWLHGTWPDTGRRKPAGDGGLIEVYAKERYFTVTGRHVAGTSFTIEERDREVAAFHAREFPPPSAPTPESAATETETEGTLDDDDLLIRAMKDDRFARLFICPFEQLRLPGCPTRSEADFALAIQLAALTNKNPGRMDALFRRSARMRPKWDEQRGAQTYGQVTIAKAISRCTHTVGAPARPVLISLADVQPRRLDWLWAGRIPLGKLTLLVGDPDLGKSYASTDIASRISRGAPFPDGERAPQGNVLFISAEDGVDDTIVPRLMTLGADMDRMRLFESVRDDHGDRMLNLDHDLDMLEVAISETNALMIVIDPLSAYLGGKNSWKDDEIRRVLTPVAALAQRRNVAIVAIMHLSKASDRRALHRVMGSVAFVAACRSALVFAQHPDRENRRVMAQLKKNLSGRVPPLSYELVIRGNATPLIGADGQPLPLLPVVEWFPEDRPSVTNVDALVSPVRSRNVDHNSRRTVQMFLGSLFDDAEAMPAQEIFSAARQGGVSKNMLTRFKEGYLSVKESRTDGQWWWIKPGVRNPQNAILGERIRAANRPDQGHGQAQRV